MKEVGRSGETIWQQRKSAEAAGRTERSGAAKRRPRAKSQKPGADLKRVQEPGPPASFCALDHARRDSARASRGAGDCRISSRPKRRWKCRAGICNRQLLIGILLLADVAGLRGPRWNWRRSTSRLPALSAPADGVSWRKYPSCALALPRPPGRILTSLGTAPQRWLIKLTSKRRSWRRVRVGRPATFAADAERASNSPAAAAEHLPGHRGWSSAPFRRDSSTPGNYRSKLPSASRYASPWMRAENSQRACGPGCRCRSPSTPAGGAMIRPRSPSPLFLLVGCQSADILRAGRAGRCIFRRPRGYRPCQPGRGRVWRCISRQHALINTCDDGRCRYNRTC